MPRNEKRSAGKGGTSGRGGAGRAGGKGGCAMALLLAGALLLWAGVQLMQRWDTLGGGGKSGAIVLLVLGTLVLLPFVLLGAGYLVLKSYLRRVQGEMGKAFEELKQAGGAMVADTKALYETIHEFRPAEEDDFDDLDVDAYDSAQRQLEGLGFRHLGDIVDETIEQISGMTTVVRVFASADGTTMAGFYHFVPPHAPPGFEDRELLLCDLTTEFGDGTFLASANTETLNPMTPPPGIEHRQHPLETPLAELVALHEAEKQKLLAAKLSAGLAASPVVINAIDDAIASAKRQQALKNAFRKRIGYVDPEDVRRIASARADGDEALGDIAAKAADAARKKELESQE
jgi:hypothetical protein